MKFSNLKKNVPITMSTQKNQRIKTFLNVKAN